MFLRIGEKSYIYILDNPLLFPTVKKNFQNRLQLMKVLQKCDTTFLRRSIVPLTVLSCCTAGW